MNTMSDALMLLRTARDGVEDPELFTDVLSGFEAGELRRIVVDMAVLVDIAVKAESWERFEQITEFMGDWMSDPNREGK
jgi:hypothetical protein